MDAAAVYVQHLHRAGVVHQAVDHAVVTAASGVQATKLAAKRLSYTLWIVSEWPENELDTGSGDLPRQPL